MRYLTPRTLSNGWPFTSLQDDINHLLDTRLETSMSNIAIDIAEDEKAFHFTAELPGVAKEDIALDIANNVLTLRAQKRDQREESGKNYHRSERSFGEFQRQFSLGTDVDADKAEVLFKDGVLHIELPKAESHKVKKLTIKS